MQDVRNVIDAFSALIDTTTVSEQTVQQYIEEHPFLITGIGAFISFNIIISQLSLGSEFRVDFAWLDQRSFGPRVHLVEIESPLLLMLNQNGEFSQGYNHAVQQLRDWHHWTRQNANYLENLLEPLGTHRDIRVECHLIAGRRSDLDTERARRRYRAFQDELQAWMHVWTWDGFLDNISIPRITSPKKKVKCVSYRDQQYFEKQIASIK